MKISGLETYWGQEMDQELGSDIKRQLGEDRELHTPGQDADETSIRQQALQLAAQYNDEGLRINARQMILMKKGAFGSGVNLSFPTKEQIDEHMHDYDLNHLHQVYGDASLTTPTKWWTALGGMGV